MGDIITIRPDVEFYLDVVSFQVPEEADENESKIQWEMKVVETGAVETIGTGSSIKYKVHKNHAGKTVVFRAYIDKECKDFPQQRLVCKIAPKILIKEAGGSEQAKIGGTVEYQVTKYSVDEGQVPESLKEKVKWDYRLGSEKQKNLTDPATGQQLTGSRIRFTVPDEWAGREVKLFPYLVGPNSGIFAPLTVEAAKEVIRIEITSKITGYTIQALKGLNFLFSDPVVIVPTYEANICRSSLNVKNESIQKVVEGSFNVTRDAWYYLGENTSGKMELLNRAFVPVNYQQNVYGLMWIAEYPRLSGAGAFILTRYGERKLPAKPLRTQEKLNGSPIGSPRPDVNFATDVMLHIGGTYEVFTVDHVGGSYGCFGFIPQDDVYPTIGAAEKAVEDDKYDDRTSNSDWKIITDKIIRLAFPEKKELQLILIDRDENRNYIPEKILKE